MTDSSYILYRNHVNVPDPGSGCHIFFQISCVKNKYTLEIPKVLEKHKIIKIDFPSKSSIIFYSDKGIYKYILDGDRIENMKKFSGEEKNIELINFNNIGCNRNEKFLSNSFSVKRYFDGERIFVTKCSADGSVVFEKYEREANKIEMKKVEDDLEMIMMLSCYDFIFDCIYFDQRYFFINHLGHIFFYSEEDNYFSKKYLSYEHRYIKMVCNTKYIVAILMKSRKVHVYNTKLERKQDIESKKGRVFNVAFYGDKLMILSYHKKERHIEHWVPVYDKKESGDIERWILDNDKREQEDDGLYKKIKELEDGKYLVNQIFEGHGNIAIQFRKETFNIQSPYDYMVSKLEKIDNDTFLKSLSYVNGVFNNNMTDYVAEVDVFDSNLPIKMNSNLGSLIEQIVSNNGGCSELQATINKYVSKSDELRMSHKDVFVRIYKPLVLLLFFRPDDEDRNVNYFTKEFKKYFEKLKKDKLDEEKVKKSIRLFFESVYNEITDINITKNVIFNINAIYNYDNTLYLDFFLDKLLSFVRKRFPFPSYNMNICSFNNTFITIESYNFLDKKYQTKIKEHYSYILSLDVKRNIIKSSLDLKDSKEFIINRAIVKNPEQFFGKCKEFFESLGNRETFFNMTVKFEGENAVDLGGLFAEFLFFFVDSMIKREYIIDMGNCKWFNHAKTKEQDLLIYEFFGRILGVCIVKEVSIDLNLPPLFYQKVKVYPESFRLDRNYSEELKTFNEEITNNFFINIDESSEPEYPDINPYYGNEQRLLKEEYRNSRKMKEYISRVFDDIVNISIKEQFERFYKGFERQIGRDNIGLLGAVDIYLLINSSESFSKKDFIDCINFVEFKDEEKKETFKEVINGLEDSEISDTMFFITNYRKPPRRDFRINVEYDQTAKFFKSLTCTRSLIYPGSFDGASPDYIRDLLRLSIKSNEYGYR